MIHRLALACIALVLAEPAFAWSADGHRVTGEIAWRLAAPATRDAIRAILPDGRDGTLAEAAAWADTVARRDPRFASLVPLHYVNADPDAAHVGAGRDCRCVVGAIEIERDRLRDPALPPAARLEALRLVAHFVGDVHQPLHVAHRDGRGGGTVDVVFDGRPTTLHALWDGEILKRRLRELGRRRGPRWRAWAQSLADRLPAEQRARWAAVRDPRDWADESLRLARDPLFAVRSDAVLRDAYADAAMPIVAERLTQAGVRLAALLDEAFGPGRSVGAR